MNNNESNLFVQQIKHILLGKNIPIDMKVDTPEYQELQNALDYLAFCIQESTEFAGELACGNFEATPPSRQNVLAGNLKSLHANLKHIAWQAVQVANGDYSQEVSFLGDFSEAFNTMIRQLSEREENLKRKSEALSGTADFLMSITDCIDNWVVVTSKETGEVVYCNNSAINQFLNTPNKTHNCGSNCILMNYLQSDEVENNVKNNANVELCCHKTNRFYQIKSNLIEWHAEPAYAHFIIDRTDEETYRKNIESLVYKDEMTSLYNRRYGMNYIEHLVSTKAKFSLCIIDIDGLKYVNDNFGHSFGDSYIKLVSRELLKKATDSDIIFRMGGDELCLLSTVHSKDELFSSLDDVNDTLKSLEKDYNMSFSYGIANSVNDNFFSLNELIGLADKRMYVQKREKKKVTN